MPSLFGDESGQFSKDGQNDFFAMALFTVSNPRVTWNGFRSWQRSKFPKVLRMLPEVKFSDPTISQNLRFRTLQEIADLNIRIRYAYLNKQSIPAEFRHKGRLRDGHLYSHVVGELVEMFLPIADNELRIFLDERHLKGITRQDFRQNLHSHLLPLLPPKTLIQVDMVRSCDNPNIQIADWIVGAIGWYLNGRPFGEECFQILKNNILGEGKELFEDTRITELSVNKKKQRGIK